LLLNAMPRKNRRIQVQTKTLFQLWKPTDEPAPQGTPEAFDLGLVEAPEVNIVSSLGKRFMPSSACNARSARN